MAMNITAEKVAHLLQESPQVINGILTCVTHRDLQKLTRVCRSWKMYGERLKRARARVLTFMSWKQQTNRDRRWEAMGDTDDVANYLNELYIDCGLIIVFAKLPLSRPCVGGHDFISIRDRLPPSCAVLGAVTSQGIIGTLQSGECRELQTPQRDCFSSFLIPSTLPGDAKMASFELSLEQYNNAVKENPDFLQKEEKLNELFNVPQEPIRCLVLISPDYYTLEIGEEIAKAFSRKEGGQLALCGGVAEAVMAVPPNVNETKEPGLVGLLISGTNVRAASIKLEPQINTKTALRYRMSQLKATVESWGVLEQSMAFFFTCCARGKNFYHHKNVETRVFREFFPETPVAGMFSLGEYGWDYMIDSEPSSDSCLLSYNTVIGYIGII